jgi:hypothetical protein
MKPEERPIGYWLRELDQRLEAAFVAALSAEGIQRRHWQVLNGLGPADPFWAAGESPYREVVADLSLRGWTTPAAGLTAAGLTAAGEAARARIAAGVARLRGQATKDVPDADYLTTVRTLARMSANLTPTV